MEDMKKMIERYKRELLEYSKASSSSEKTSVFEQPPAVEKEKTEYKKPRVIGYISDDAQKELQDMKVPEEIIESIRSEEIIPDTAVPPSEDSETITYTAPENADENSSDETSEPTDLTQNGTNEEETFSEPHFTTIPSFSETRQNITDESKSEENVATENVSGVTDNSANTPRAEYGNNKTVSNEKAERLTEQPISGTSEDEQLTGRSFEDGRMQENDPDDALERNGSRSDISNFTETDFADLEEFEQKNIGSGTILFRVYTAREALPVENAVCTITKTFDGKTHTFYKLITDSSGKTATEPLPAPSNELSQDSENTIQPFALYDATVTHKGYADVELKEIPVFDGVSSVQQVGMIPIPEMNMTQESDENAR